ncbi:MAG: hypothetical protein HYV09_00890 [Deltaproteobacteria bacterium]|nr:hypothetical protein [Deltaproteobacteria bacterium]
MRSFGFALGVLVVVVGCSSSDGGSPAYTADEACTQFVDMLCAKVQTCAPTYLTMGYGDIATCKTRVMLECKAGLAAPSTSQTPNDMVACVNDAKTVTCSALLDNNPPASCLAKPGGLDEGKPCATDSQCKTAFCAIDDDKEVCGICASKPGEGGKCNRGKCAQGLKCARNDTCAKAVAEGGACDDAKPCAAGTSCFAGKCTKDQATEGAVCDPALKTAAGCDGLQGFLCLPGVNKCMKAKVASVGQECGADIEAATFTVKSFTICEKGGYCKGVDFEAKPPVFKGTCVQAAADGEACIPETDGFKGPGCLEPAECVANVCRLPDASTCK